MAARQQREPGHEKKLEEGHASQPSEHCCPLTPIPPGKKGEYLGWDSEARTPGNRAGAVLWWEPPSSRSRCCTSSRPSPRRRARRGRAELGHQGVTSAAATSAGE